MPVAYKYFVIAATFFLMILKYCVVYCNNTLHSILISLKKNTCSCNYSEIDATGISASLSREKIKFKISAKHPHPTMIKRLVPYRGSIPGYSLKNYPLPGYSLQHCLFQFTTLENAERLFTSLSITPAHI